MNALHKTRRPLRRGTHRSPPEILWLAEKGGKEAERAKGSRKEKGDETEPVARSLREIVRRRRVDTITKRGTSSTGKKGESWRAQGEKR